MPSQTLFGRHLLSESETVTCFDLSRALMHETAQVMRLAIMRHYTAGLLNTMTHFGSTLGNFVKSLAS